MPFRNTASKRLAELFGLLSNPNRVRLIEELSSRSELDVNSLESELGISHSAVSQHLSLLRAHRIVRERREGRHVFYQLTQHKIAAWILEGFNFVQRELGNEDLEKARALWAAPAKRVSSKSR